MARVRLPKAEGGWRLERRPGGWVVAERSLPDGAVERRRIWLALSKGKLSASAGGRLVHAELLPDRESAGGAKADLDAALTAQFPGKVRKILVQPGQQVAEGDRLVLVEAMKMEFAIQAPCAGRVTQLLVQDGQQIAPGARFLHLEPAAAEGANGS